MAVPILKQSQYLIATIQSVLTDADLVEHRNVLVSSVDCCRSRSVIGGVTALDLEEGLERLDRKFKHDAGNV